MLVNSHVFTGSDHVFCWFNTFFGGSITSFATSSLNHVLLVRYLFGLLNPRVLLVKCRSKTLFSLVHVSFQKLLHLGDTLALGPSQAARIKAESFGVSQVDTGPHNTT